LDGYLVRKRGFNKSCGCAKQAYNDNRPDTYIDLIGQKFGRLEVISFSSREEYTTEAGREYYRYYWNCKCECGNEIIALGPSLKNGHTKSCGCFKIDKAKDQLLALEGVTIGKILIERFSHICNGRSYWLGRCECGNGVIISTEQILNKTKKSCGCAKYDVDFNKDAKKKKGKAKLRHTLMGMISRCNDEDNSAYKHYGARGIKVCKEWEASFDAFIADMGIPLEGYSIDRIDVNGNYCPENCRWATTGEQSRNKRNNVNFTFNNQVKCLTDWARITGKRTDTIKGRIKRGWTEEEAVFTPLECPKGTGYTKLNDIIIDCNGVTEWN
jgi:hypothetical protein